MAKSIGKFAGFIIIGLILVVLGDQLVLYGLRQVKHDDLGVWNRVVDGEINTEILCAGSSRALVHLDPRIIGPEMGMTCFNLGLDGSPLNFQLPLLETYYKYNEPPRILIQGLDVLSVQSRKNIYKAHQYIPYLNEEPIYQNLVKYDSKFWRYRYLPAFGFATYGLQLRSDAVAGLLGLNQESFRISGFTPVYKEWTGEFEQFKATHPDGITYEIEDEAIENLKKIIRLARNHGTEIILLYTPEYFENQKLTNNFAQIMETFKAIAEETQVPFLDYSADSLCYRRELFYNSQHLNATGAELFSNILARDLQQVAGQPVLERK